MAGKPFFRGRTKQELKKEIQALLKPIPFYEEFSSELISDLILEKHYYCSQHDLRPTQFCKKRGQGEYDFWGFFPDYNWHQVSWRQCIYPPKDKRIIAQALRLAVDPIKADYKRLHPVCELCDSNPTEVAHHANPTFDEMVGAGIALMTEADWEAARRKFDWLNEEAFQLPAENPALQHVLIAHKSAQLQALCKTCHHEVHR